MINYIADKQAFFLCGRSFSYVMYIDRHGNLQNLHYGAKIDKTDVGYLIEQIADTITGEFDDLNFYARERVFSECGTYGRGDYRMPSVIVERHDGGTVSEFKYVSHSIAHEAPELLGLPHVRDGETLSIVLRDSCSDTEIQLFYSVYDDCDVLVRSLRVINKGERPIYLKRAYSFCVDLRDREFRVLRLYGAWTRERTPEITECGHGITRLQSSCGASSFGIHPFLGLLEKDCLEEVGTCYGVQLVYSGNFALNAERNSFDAVRLCGGINDERFCWEIDGGGDFITPQALLCYSENGLGALSRAYADFIRKHIVDPSFAYKPRPIVINNWEATYFDFDSEKLFPIIDEAAELGIDTFVLDDGWFGKRDSDKSGLGDWTVNENKLSGGLSAVIDRCKMRGMKFGLWFEPEMVSPDSDLYRAHPDWAIHKENVKPIVGRKQLVLDFTRREIVDYIFDRISKILTENDISYVKWDMNRFITECYSDSLPSHRQGEFMHRYILGVYNLAERLVGSFPHVCFEGCASGGGRFDAGMLYYFPHIWTSDNTDACDRAKIQFGTSFCYPVSAMSCHVSACPNHQTGRVTPFATRGAIASLGIMGYELDLTKLSHEEKQLVKRQISDYQEIADLVLTGDLYRLSNPFTDGSFCEMIVSKDKNRAVVVGEQIHSLPNSPAKFIRIGGLDANKTYIIKQLKATACGKTLATVGVPLPKLKDFESFFWNIEVIDH